MVKGYRFQSVICELLRNDSWTIIINDRLQMEDGKYHCLKCRLYIVFTFQSDKVFLSNRLVVTVNVI